MKKKTIRDLIKEKANNEDFVKSEDWFAKQSRKKKK